MDESSKRAAKKPAADEGGVPGDIYVSGLYAAIWSGVFGFSLLASYAKECPKTSVIAIIAFAYNLLVAGAAIAVYATREDARVIAFFDKYRVAVRYGQLVSEVVVTGTVFASVFFGEQCAWLKVFGIVYVFVQAVVLSLLVCSALGVAVFSPKNDETPRTGEGDAKKSARASNSRKKGRIEEPEQLFSGGGDPETQPLNASRKY